MGSFETWRVVLASGEVREVRVERGPAQASHWVATCGRRTTFPHATPKLAVWSLVRGFLGESFDVRETLAPGVPTRAELEAQLAAVTAHRDQLLADAATARREGAEAMRDAILFGPHHLMLSAYQEGRIAEIALPLDAPSGQHDDAGGES